MSTEIVVLLDRSGSMSGLEKDTIGGFNAFIEKQKEEEGVAFVTTVLFDDEYEILHDRVNIEEVEELTSEKYYARGMTALLDAIGKGINNVKDLKEDSKVIFVITTDGEENSSREYNLNQIKELIKSKSEWQFIFLGANIDAISTAEGLGISGKFASKYTADSEGTDKLYRTVSKAVSKFREEGIVAEDWDKELK